MSEYGSFLEAKTSRGADCGIDPLWMPPGAFDFQQHLISWTLRKGRAALFSDTGTGKSLILWVRNRTMCHNLSHKTIVDDGALGGVASADYLLIFRKPGKITDPADHPVGLTEYAGEEPIPAQILKYKGFVGKQTENRFSQWIWRHYASSIWDDIRMHRVLPFQDCKDPDDEKHVHPLQLDVIDRFVALRTKPGETVLTPFMGVGSEVYSPVCMGRRAIGAELKPSYFRQAVANMEAIKSGGAFVPTTQDDPGQERIFDAGAVA